MTSWWACTRTLGQWRPSGLAGGQWSAWEPCSSCSSTSTPTTAVCSAPAVRVLRFLCVFLFLSLFSSSADSFETMLKSLLGYQSSLGGGATEAVLRKKVYQGAIDRTLEKNFQLVLKVGSG